ncbi:MAG TPA: MBL fold metallo-hydrolase [Burkholderiales bacterium]
MLIQLLGTGNPSPSLARMSSGYLAKVGEDVILFDHGPGAYHRLLEAGYSPMDPTHLFFTHLHYDHCLDYVRLILTRWDQGAGKAPELRVFGPPPLAAMTDLLFSRQGAFAPDLRARTEHRLSLDIYEERGGTLPRAWPQPAVREIKSTEVVEGGSWTITTTSAVHAQPQLQCYAYRLDCDDGSFVYSGDSGPSRRITELADRCDVLVHMCAYESGTELSDVHAKTCTGHLELARIAAEAQVKTLVLSHFNTNMVKPDVRARILGEMAKIYPGKIVWGEDLMAISVGQGA